MRIGLTYSAWKADVLPLNYTRIQLTLIIIIAYDFFVNSFFEKNIYFFILIYYEKTKRNMQRNKKRKERTNRF